ncbi:MAG: prolyl oligopeptidase family serine peptidase [Planctomycetota bacterium]
MQSYSDNFDRGNQSLASSGNWTNIVSALNVSANRVVPSGSGIKAAQYQQLFDTADQEASVVVDSLAAAKNAAVGVRLGPNGGVWFNLSNAATNTYRIFESESDISLDDLLTRAAVNGTPPSFPATIKVLVVGQEVKGFVNGAEVISHTLASTSKNSYRKSGIWAQDASAALDDFAAADVTPTTTESLSYASTIDPALDDLRATLHYNDDAASGLRPLVVMMHGWTQDSTAFDAAVGPRWAEYGVGLLMVEMRGRNSSSGSPDSGGREIHDIIDAIDHVLDLHPTRFSRFDVHADGYSGGGANALSLVSRYPDRFGSGYAFYPISDYGWDTTDGWWFTSPSRRSQLTAWIGDRAVAANIFKYKSRASVLGISNFAGKLNLYHDAADTNVPPINSENVFDARTETSYSLTDVGDDPRWLHESPNGTADVIEAEAEIAALITSGDYPAVPIGSTWSGVVLGYLVTDAFEIWLGDGTEDFGNVLYNANRSVVEIDFAQDGDAAWSIKLKGQAANSQTDCVINGVTYRGQANADGVVTYTAASTVVSSGLSDVLSAIGKLPNRKRLSGTRSHNLGPFFQRLFRENCQMFGFGDSTMSEDSQAWASVPVFFRRGYEIVTGRKIAGSRFRPFADWKFNKFSSSLHSTLQRGTTIPTTSIDAVTQALHIDMTSIGNLANAGKWVWSNHFGETIRNPFLTPPWVDAPFNIAFTYHEHATTPRAVLLQSKGRTTRLEFHGGTPTEGVSTAIISRDPTIGDAPEYGYEDLFQTDWGQNGGSYSGTSLTLYDIAIYRDGWIPDSTPGLFWCGEEATGGDTIYHHLPDGYESTFSGATYTDEELQFLLNPGGDTVVPNTFVVHVLNRNTTTQGGFLERTTQEQFDRIVKDWLAVFTRWQKIAELAGTPKSQQRWLFVSPWTPYKINQTSSNVFEGSSRDWAAAMREACIQMGPTASYLDMQDIIADELGRPSDYEDTYLSDGLHPSFGTVMADWWGRVAIEAIQEMESENSSAVSGSTAASEDSPATTPVETTLFETDFESGTPSEMTLGNVWAVHSGSGNPGASLRGNVLQLPNVGSDGSDATLNVDVPAGATGAKVTFDIRPSSDVGGGTRLFINGTDVADYRSLARNTWSSEEASLVAGQSNTIVWRLTQDGNANTEYDYLDNIAVTAMVESSAGGGSSPLSETDAAEIRHRLNLSGAKTDPGTDLIIDANTVQVAGSAVSGITDFHSGTLTTSQLAALRAEVSAELASRGVTAARQSNLDVAVSTRSSHSAADVTGGGSSPLSTTDAEELRHRLNLSGTKTDPGSAWTVNANLISVLGTAITTTIRDAFTFFFNQASPAKKVNDVGGGSGGSGGTDWTGTEREQIRYRLGIDGTASAPTERNPNLPQNPNQVISADNSDPDDAGHFTIDQLSDYENDNQVFPIGPIRIETTKPVTDATLFFGATRSRGRNFFDSNPSVTRNPIHHFTGTAYVVAVPGESNQYDVFIEIDRNETNIPAGDFGWDVDAVFSDNDVTTICRGTLTLRQSMGDRDHNLAST